jgi:hypothetical protein
MSVANRKILCAKLFRMITAKALVMATATLAKYRKWRSLSLSFKRKIRFSILLKIFLKTTLEKEAFFGDIKSNSLEVLKYFLINVFHSTFSDNLGEI